MSNLGYFLRVICLLLFIGGCSKQSQVAGDNSSSAIKEDFSSAEGAILCLERAYRVQDVEAAVACKDFQIEARQMLQKLQNLPDDQIDDELVKKTAEVLELAFRKELQQNGFPNMNGVRSTFPEKKLLGEDLVLVTEVCHYPDGQTSQQKILVAKAANGWRVLNPAE